MLLKLCSCAIGTGGRRERGAVEFELRGAARLSPRPVEFAASKDFLDILLAPGLDDGAIDVRAFGVFGGENTANLNLADAALRFFSPFSGVRMRLGFCACSEAGGAG